MAKSKQHPSARVKGSTKLRNLRQRRALGVRLLRAHEGTHGLCSTSIAQLAMVRDALVKGVRDLNDLIEVQQEALELAEAGRAGAQEEVSAADARVVAAGFPSINEAPDPLAETEFEAREEAETKLREALRRRK